MSDNEHASNLAAQLRQFEDDEHLPDDIRERARERREALEERCEEVSDDA